MKLSLVVPTFNRTDFVIEAFVQVLENPSIDEIVIVDDYSKPEIFCALWNLVNNLQNDKVKLFRNDKNLGPLLNKYEAVKWCKNDWCIMIDSDNIIDNDYVEKILTLEKEEDMLYCPETLKEVNGKINFSYEEFCSLIVDKDNVKKYIGHINFETWMNTGNYFFNKNRYLHNIESNKIDTRLSLTDSVYFSYLWLLSGNRMKIVPDMYYIHRIHKGSWWQNHSKDCVLLTAEIVEKIRNITIRKEKILKIIVETDLSFAPYYGTLPKLINERGYKKGIEIGVFAGGHAASILNNSELKQLIGIDPYVMYKKGGCPGGMDSQEDFDCMYSLVIDRLKSERYIHFRIDSDKAIDTLKSDRFDFVFIDGLHTYDQVKKDLYNYDKLIKKGGIIACHDYNHSGYPEVARAIDEFVRLHNAKIVICPLYAIYMEKTW